MASLNKVLLIGYVGDKPKFTKATSGGGFASFSLATSESWKDKQTGENKSVTEWHRVQVFNALAEIADKYIFKGSLVYVEGQIKTVDFTNDKGEKISYKEIRASKIHLLDKKGENTQQGGQNSEKSANSATQYKQENILTAEEQADFEDDMPF